MDGTAFGLMRMVTLAVLEPLELVAPSTSGKSPLAVAVPLITPVFALTARPPGSPVAM
jgi:hypothetical protein